MQVVTERDSVLEWAESAATVGMTLSVWADVQPSKPAVIDPQGGIHTFLEINRRANQIVRLLRDAGLRSGDPVALICSNRSEFVEVLAACLRGGFRLTPVNWHLTAEEIAYLLNDCEAKAIFAEARITSVSSAAAQAPGLVLRLAIGGDIDGFMSFDTTLVGIEGSDIADPSPGATMLYTSGTTGRPKGVLRPPLVIPRATLTARRYDENSVQLCVGPAYHAGPLNVDVQAALRAGATLVFRDKWDTEQVLQTIAARRVTHVHMVPTMFQRLLALPAEVKAKYDISSLTTVVHGAAPCPVEVKRAVIEWFGPVLLEYYAGSEGGAGFWIDSHEWLKKPGSVGKRPELLGSKVVDENGAECPPNVAGTIYHQVPPDGGFTYYKDENKTAASRLGDYFTLGDIGYFDEDGYLFLTGRNAETIISGGVNIHPQEIDNELIKHQAVADCATVGVPHEEWGEEVKAVIQLEAGYQPSDLLADDILRFARERLAAFKAPRSVHFVTELPRSEAGKIQRNKVRAPFWGGRARQI
ncbi:AMP-binding protein [Mesorhizobium sp. BHbdii]